MIELQHIKYLHSWKKGSFYTDTLDPDDIARYFLTIQIHDQIMNIKEILVDVIIKDMYTYKTHHYRVRQQ